MINPEVRSVEFLTPQVKLDFKKFLQQQYTVDYFAVSFSQRKLRLLTFNIGVESNWNSFEIRSIRFENLRFD